MDQNAEALSHYYHLRAQGASPDGARMHVRLRFGIRINGDLPDPDAVTESVVPEREPMEFGEDFCKTTWGTSTGPQYGRPSDLGGDYCECCDPDVDRCHNRTER